VVYCNVPPPIFMDNLELGKLLLKHANVPDRKFPKRKYDWYLWKGARY